MTLIQALVLGLLQGATEFLPISSSGHLVLVPWLLGWKASSLTFDTTVHLGTLLAVAVYFWADIVRITKGVFNTLRQRSLADADGRLGWLVALGSIPAAVIGYALSDFFERLFGTPALVSVLLLVTGVILFTSERASQKLRDLPDLTWKDSLLVGLAQAAAIAPGISRSGSTIAAGLALGIKREDSARFSFLLAMPVIFGAGLLQFKDMLSTGIDSTGVTLLAVGFIAAALSGYVCIRFLMAYLRERSLTVFAVYCWLFGAFTLVVALLRG